MTQAEAAPTTTRWTAQWKELYEEVITTGLCTGCSGCVVTCPYDVIGYEHSEGKYLPFHLDDELGPTDCSHGQTGCTMCTRSCPRFRTWETSANEHLFGRDREPDEMYGVWRKLYLTRASDEMVHKMGQDGGLVSAMLIWLRDNDYIDAALVSGVDSDDRWKAQPRVVTSRDEILATAGSRYTYCANPLALNEARNQGHDRLALVGMGCQVSSPPTMWARKAGKVSKPILFNIGLLCSKTFDDSIFAELFEAKYGLAKADMVKMNIKGVFQIWMRDGSYHEIDLKETHAWTRAGCVNCPDFSAEHADVSTGGIGEDNDWTLTVVRTELGEEVIERMIADGSIIAKPAQEDATAMRLLKLLSIVSRRRWPASADPAPAVGVPPPKKKATPSDTAPQQRKDSASMTPTAAGGSTDKATTEAPRPSKSTTKPATQSGAKKSTPAKKPGAKKAAPAKQSGAKKSAAKKAIPAKKSAAKKATPAKKAAANKPSRTTKQAKPAGKATGAKKSASKKATPAKKATAKKATTKKATSKKATTKKATTAKKATTKKATTAKKATAAKKSSATKQKATQKAAAPKKVAAKKTTAAKKRSQQAPKAKTTGGANNRSTPNKRGPAK